MIKVGDTVLNGNAVVVEISDNYRVFKLQSLYLGDPQTNSYFTVTFDAGATADMIAQALGA